MLYGQGCPLGTYNYRTKKTITCGEQSATMGERVVTIFWANVIHSLVNWDNEKNPNSAWVTIAGDRMGGYPTNNNLDLGGGGVYAGVGRMVLKQ